MSEIAVHFAGVNKRYPPFQLADITFELPAGGILGLIGANAAGKSTLLRILLGLVLPDSGRVEVFGLPMPGQEVAIKRLCGFAAGDQQLYKTANLRWHLAFLADLFPAWDRAYAAELLRRFELDPEKKIEKFSLGQKVKANLLLALARRPRLLVLDEPTLGLDPLARQEILGILLETLADERGTVIFSSQNTHDIEQISDQILFIDRGRLIEGGDKESFLDRWRRLRLELAPGATPPALPGMVAAAASGRIAVCTTSRFDDRALDLCRAAGAAVLAVEPMTLEEVFIASVQSRRQGVAA